ncbi:hypothetical protein MRB53_038646 [Persea americana]|nr:hypothetical protein MRB53_038646 [Persea americana]
MNRVTTRDSTASISSSRRSSSSSGRQLPAFFHPSVHEPSQDSYVDDSEPDTLRGRAIARRLSKRRPLSTKEDRALDIDAVPAPPSSFPVALRTDSGLKSTSAASPLLRSTSASSSKSSDSLTRSRPRSRSFGTRNDVSWSPESVSSTGPQRRSWFRSLSRSRSKASKSESPPAWLAERAGRVAYDLAPLINAAMVKELWLDSGDTLVYLFPRATDKGPSFRIHSSLFASSVVLRRLADVHWGLAAGQVRRESGVGITALYLPVLAKAEQLAADDTNALVAVRNLFAFLLGQSLVCTEALSTTFKVFIKISDKLRDFKFVSEDSTFGPVASHSFDAYVDELALADVRSSGQKTIEGLVLGERMKCRKLYHEAWIHAAGKFAELEAYSTLQSGFKFDLISVASRNRLERASIELFHKEKSMATKLIDFEFPALFSGIMNSRTADERKLVQFGAWRAAFGSTRKFILTFYRAKFGAWPPKQGMTRRVLKVLYHDLSLLYDLYVDRTSLTTRGTDWESDDQIDDIEEPVARALRRVLEEYDRCSPPVLPPVPFDIPLLPSLQSNPGGFRALKESNPRAKRLKNSEIADILAAACNGDAQSDAPFVAAFRQFVAKECSGCNITELVEIRVGIWLFIYVVIQTLPLLVVDAPGVAFAKDVDYFLCCVPPALQPWQTDKRGRKKDKRASSVPPGINEDGVEAIYRRSHCWLAASRWAGISLGATRNSIAGVSVDAAGRTSKVRFDSSANVTIEPNGVLNRQVSKRRRPSTGDPTRTFDDILASIERDKQQPKSRGK